METKTAVEKKNLENQSFVKNVSGSNFPTSSMGGGAQFICNNPMAK